MLNVNEQAYVDYFECTPRNNLKKISGQFKQLLNAANSLDTLTFFNGLGFLSGKARDALSRYLNASRLCDGGKNLTVRYRDQVFTLGYDIDHTRSTDAFKATITFTNEKGVTQTYTKEAFGFFYRENGVKKLMPLYVENLLNRALENLRPPSFRLTETSAQ